MHSNSSNNNHHQDEKHVDEKTTPTSENIESVERGCDDDCCICLEKLVSSASETDYCTLPCQHRLHSKCLVLLRGCSQESSKRCPLCRSYVFTNSDEMNDEAGTLFMQIEEAVSHGEASWDDLDTRQEEKLADSISLWTNAANLGNSRAQCNLGNLYRWGLGVAHSNKKAMKLYLAASIKGNANAQYHLGYCLEQLEHDILEAIYWFKKAGMQGHVRAQHKVGTLLETHGTDIGQNSVIKLDNNLAESARWYQRAAQQGFYQSQCSLGILYEQGRGVERDYSKAAFYYKLAANQGDAAALTNLGTMYNDGRGVAQSHHYAIFLYRKAARQGYARAQFNLAFKYEEGSLNLDNGLAHAVKWYLKAAEQGYASAQCNLGVMYENGKAAHINGTVASEDDRYIEALRWFEKGAEQGHIDCLVNLALMNELGKGIQINLDMALALLQTAVQLGCVSIDEHIERVEKKRSVLEQELEDESYLEEGDGTVI